MQRVVCKLFRRFGRKRRICESSQSPASSLSFAALAILCTGGLLSHTAAAQASAKSPATGIGVKQPLSAEILAMHARAKRAVASVSTSLELPTTSALASTTLNSDQGPGPWPDRSRTGVQSVPGTRVDRHHSSSIVFRATTFRHKPWPGWAGSIAEYGRG
jgi:hypothetical protein